MALIDKDQMKAEIRRRLSLIHPLKGDFTDGSRDAYEGLLSWLDTRKETPTWVIRAEQRKKDQAAGKKFAIMEIRAEIERRMFEDYNGPDAEQNETAQGVCAGLLAFLDTLEAEENNAFCKENCKGYQDTGRCFCDGGCEAKKKSKEKEVDLEEHYKQWLEEYMEQSEGYYPTAQAIALHFYELGCRHTAVMYDDIEHERQRAEEAEEAEITNNLEEEMDKFFGIYRDEDGYAYDSETNHRCLDWKDDEEEEHKMLLARHFAEWGAEHMKK